MSSSSSPPGRGCSSSSASPAPPNCAAPAQPSDRFRVDRAAVGSVSRRPRSRRIGFASTGRPPDRPCVNGVLRRRGDRRIGLLRQR
eukprot:3602926-Pyramimonas_sp.AAC.1